MWKLQQNTPQRITKNTFQVSNPSETQETFYISGESDPLITRRQGPFQKNVCSSKYCHSLKKGMVWSLSNAIFFSIPVTLAMLGLYIWKDRLLKNDVVLVELTVTTPVLRDILMIQTVYTYFLCSISFLGFIFVRFQVAIKQIHYNPNDVLLLFGAVGHLLLLLFETVDAIGVLYYDKGGSNSVAKVLYDIKIAFHFIGLYSQTVLIIRFSRMVVDRTSLLKGKQLLIKSSLVFVGMFNFERWIVDKFLTPIPLAHVYHASFAMYGNTNWWYVTELLHPLVIVMRLQAAIMCFEACVRCKQKSFEQR